MTNIAFQIIKKNKPTPNGNFESLVLVYDQDGKYYCIRQRTSTPSTAGLTKLPQLPTIYTTASEMRNLRQSAVACLEN